MQEKVLKQLRGETPNENHLKDLVSQLENKLDVLDAILSKQNYLAGDVSH